MKKQVIAVMLKAKRPDLANAVAYNRVEAASIWKFGAWDGEEHYWPETGEWEIMDAGRPSRFKEFDDVTYGLTVNGVLEGFVDFKCNAINLGYHPKAGTGTWEMSAADKTEKGTIKDFKDVLKILKKMRPKILSATKAARDKITNLKVPPGWELTGYSSSDTEWDRQGVDGELAGKWSKYESYHLSATLYDAEDLVAGNPVELELRLSDFGGMSKYGDTLLSKKLRPKSIQEVEKAIEQFNQRAIDYVVKERRKREAAVSQ